MCVGLEVMKVLVHIILNLLLTREALMEENYR